MSQQVMMSAIQQTPRFMAVLIDEKSVLDALNEFRGSEQEYIDYLRNSELLDFKQKQQLLVKNVPTTFYNFQRM